MSAEILLFGGFLDGDLVRDPNSADYVGGQPCEITATGVKVTSTDANYMGILKNDKGDDDKSGPQVGDSPVTGDLDCTVIFGTNKVELRKGVTAAGAVASPYVFPGTAHAWVEGDEVFNNAAGKWDNQTAGGSVARGRVVKAPLADGDAMHVYFYK